MTKQNAKDFLPLVQALAEGKTIQYFNGYLGEWEDNDKPRFDDDIRKYRIKPKFFVFKKNDGTYYKSKEYEHNIKGANWQFEGDEEECEKWIEEHTKKTWLDEYLDKKYLKDMGVRNPVTKGITEICKKILEEVRTNEGIEQMTKFYIGEIIKNLGVKV